MAASDPVTTGDTSRSRGPFGHGRWAAGLAVLGLLAFIGVRSSFGPVMLVVAIGSLIAAVGLVIGGLVVGVRGLARGEPGARKILGALAGAAVVAFCASAARNSARYGLRARSAETRTVLGGIKTQQAEFRERTGVYLSAGPNPASAPGRTRRRWDANTCSTECSSRPEACRSFECIEYRPALDPFYQYTCTATAADGVPDFTCVAVGDLDADGEMSVFVYGTANRTGGGEHATIVVPIPEIAPLGECANGAVPAGRVVECTPGID